MSTETLREEVKACLSHIGKTPVDVARELHVGKGIVRGVLSGRFKGDRGDAHKVAVALGLKAGVIIDDRTPIAEALREQVARRRIANAA